MIKRFLLVITLLIGLALPVQAAITRGAGPVSGDGPYIGTQDIILPGTTIGGMIVLLIGYNSNTIDSITISGEADATLVSAANMSANGDNFSIYYLANNTGGGSKTITIHVTGGGVAYGSAVAVEYLGQDKLSQPDVTTTSTTGTTGDPTIGITTALAGDLIISMCSSNGGKPTMPSGYADLNLSNPGYYANAADNVAAGVAGAKTLIWTDVFNSSWGVNAVAFKAAVVSGGAIMRHKVIGQ